MRKAAFLLAILGVFFLSSCITNRKNIAPPEEPLKTIEKEGLVLTLRYVDETELIGQFGSEINPFLSTYYRAQFQRIIVFELNIENGGSSTYNFDSSNCMMNFGGKNIEADNPFKLTKYWQQLDNEGRNLNNKIAVINKFMLPGREKVAADGELTGYLVFRASGLPREGEGQVDIYSNASGKFEFSYNFIFPEQI